MEGNRVQYWSVYILQNIACSPAKSGGRGSRKYYVGMTNNVEKRVGEHNRGASRATRGGVWELLAVLNFRTAHHAAIVEQWLKNGDTRSKREEVVSRMILHSGSELESYAYFRIANKWWERKEARNPQKELGE